MGEFFIEGTDIAGFMLEEKGPSTSLPGLQQRIPSGEYQLVWHSGAKFPKALRLWNAQVPHERAILIHAGNRAQDTQGCLLPGLSRGENCVFGSRAMVQKIYQCIESKGFIGGEFKEGAGIVGGASLFITERWTHGV